MTVHPTGTCFDDVLDQQDHVYRTNHALAMRQSIVHGICLIPEGQLEQGKPYAHAWVEDDIEDRVYQSGLLNGTKIWWGIDRAEYYQLMRVQKFTVYTFHEALWLNYQTNHFGPWVPEYIALCRERTEPCHTTTRLKTI
jgi:hypothetical protein